MSANIKNSPLKVVLLPKSAARQRRALAIAVLALLGTSWFSAAQAVHPYGSSIHEHNNRRVSKAVVPEGMNGFLVFSANARVDIRDVIPIDGTDFHVVIMGRGPAEFESVRQEALDFFSERYGIVDANSHPDILFRPYQVEPISNYRAYVVGGYKVPARGWEVRDGGWEARVINPEGMVLGGNFEGLHVPAGTFMVYGDYNILACSNKKVRYQGHCDNPEEIIMHYQSGEPALIEGPDLPGVITFRFSCEVFSEKWGAGLAQGISLPEIIDDGSFQYNVRNVVTFTDSNGF